MGSKLLFSFSVLIQELIFTFPIILFSLQLSFTLSSFSIIRTKCYSHAIASLFLPFILNSQRSIIFSQCYSLFSCLVAFFYFSCDLILNSHHIRIFFSSCYLFSALTTPLMLQNYFCLSLFSIVMSEHESLDNVLYSHVLLVFRRIRS